MTRDEQLKCIEDSVGAFKRTLLAKASKIPPNWDSMEIRQWVMDCAKGEKHYVDREKKVIEAALEKSGGRVSGPSGAAKMLRIPHQTLESKIAKLGIDKRRFREAPRKTRSS